LALVELVALEQRVIMVQTQYFRQSHLLAVAVAAAVQLVTGRVA
jgi:hypothetical protein